MTLEVRLRPEAEQDLTESAAWYEQQRTGLGQEFLDAALATVSATADIPRFRGDSPVGAPCTAASISIRCVLGPR
jgi:hypothetical protein